MRKILLLFCLVVPSLCRGGVLHVGNLEFQTFTTQQTEHAIVIMRDTGAMEYVPLTKKWYDGTLHVKMDEVIYSACNTNFHRDGHYYFCGDDLVAADDTICAHDFYYDGHYYFCGNNLIGADDNVYLESTGTQIIDTDFVPTTKSRAVVELKLKNLHDISYLDNLLFGVTTAETNSPVLYAFAVNLGGGSTNVYSWIYPYSDRYAWTSHPMPVDSDFLSVRHTLVLDSKNQFASYGEYSVDLEEPYVDCLQSMFLFGGRFGENGDLYPFARFDMYLYSAKLYDDDILLRHFIPVPAGLQIGNFTVPENGMWDIVEQRFYGNDGTGDFIYGVDE